MMDSLSTGNVMQIYRMIQCDVYMRQGITLIVMCLTKMTTEGMAIKFTTFLLRRLSRRGNLSTLIVLYTVPFQIKRGKLALLRGKRLRFF